jgi:XTP/dITP diphosphohydrolase
LALKRLNQKTLRKTREKLSSDLVLASANPGKIKELQQMLGGLGFNILPQTQLNIEDIEETGLSFVENSILKARNAAAHSNLPAIADDSGLEVDFLDGAPGIYSARFAGEGATDATNRDKLLELMKEAPENQRTARYQTVIVYMRHANDPTPLICQGTWEGTIALTEKGDGGFGYDPIFQVAETNCRAAELDKQTKNKISHRGKAIANLLMRLQSQ